MDPTGRPDRTAAENPSNDRDLGHRPTPPDASSFPHHDAPGCDGHERPRNRTSTAWRRALGGRFSAASGPWPDTTEALAALVRAWTVTTIATVLFLIALAIAPVWDGAIFMQGCVIR